MTTNRFSSSQGDGISMALEAGASLTDMEQIPVSYTHLASGVNAGSNL